MGVRIAGTWGASQGTLTSLKFSHPPQGQGRNHREAGRAPIPWGGGAEEAAFEVKLSRSAEKVRGGGQSIRFLEAAGRSLAGGTRAPGLERSWRGQSGPLATGRVLVFISRALEATEGL